MAAVRTTSLHVLLYDFIPGMKNVAVQLKPSNLKLNKKGFQMYEHTLQLKHRFIN